MSHISVYLGKGGCLLKILFRYLEIIGWFKIFENPSIHTTLDRALLAPHSQLYEQPFVYITCKNEKKHFPQIYQCDLHFLIMHEIFIL